MPVTPAAGSRPSSPTRLASPLASTAVLTSRDRDLLGCPSCRSSQVAQVLGDNGEVSYVCTACGHSWS
ncbi:hypothetical protein ACTU45_33030 [Streptomyces sp. 24-1644]|uniref:hypothetical protein n=1 Tax=Streptomyces sp. 24-1644 TaxID=3457315 RepID=UPI003FA6963A